MNWPGAGRGEESVLEPEPTVANAPAAFLLPAAVGATKRVAKSPAKGKSKPEINSDKLLISQPATAIRRHCDTGRGAGMGRGVWVRVATANSKVKL